MYSDSTYYVFCYLFKQVLSENAREDCVFHVVVLNSCRNKRLVKWD